ncbi:MAG: hypothetical protein FJX56_04285 [Alphaproteobacteria bacterium]|nr:hypothetical protein [Alphaproteobacteria bacterium]
MTTLNRDEFMALLERLGGDDAADIVAAAREIRARMRLADVTWNMLLVPHERAPSADEPEPTRPAAPAASSPPASASREEEARHLIDQLLHQSISGALRLELEDFRRDIAEGRFDLGELDYLRKVHARLSLIAD